MISVRYRYFKSDEQSLRLRGIRAGLGQGAPCCQEEDRSRLFPTTKPTNGGVLPICWDCGQITQGEWFECMYVRWTDTRTTAGLPPRWDSMMQQEAPSCRHKRTGTTDGPIFKLPSAVSFTVRARKDSILVPRRRRRTRGRRAGRLVEHASCVACVSACATAKSRVTAARAAATLKQQYP